MPNSVNVFTGFCVKQVCNGIFTCVVRHQNRFYAATTGYMHVYNYVGELMQRHSFISVNADSFSQMTICIANNLLYVGLTRDTRIDIFSLDGQFQSSTEYKGIGEPGDLNWPFICFSDAAGNVVIADECNNRLQLFSASEQWSIMRLRPRLVKPRGACLLNDTLFVNEGERRVIHAYKMM